MLKPCTCSHAYQDKKYGVGIRYHNPTATKAPLTYRCTVCSSVKS